MCEGKRHLQSEQRGLCIGGIAPRAVLKTSGVF